MSGHQDVPLQVLYVDVGATPADGWSARFNRAPTPAELEHIKTRVNEALQAFWTPEPGVQYPVVDGSAPSGRTEPIGFLSSKNIGRSEPRN